jgi:predicted PurR-regulated permease PerM
VARSSGQRVTICPLYVLKVGSSVVVNNLRAIVLIGADGVTGPGLVFTPELVMLTTQPASKSQYVDYAVEASIHIGLLILLAVACLGIMAPFLGMIAWGMIIAIAAYPGQKKLQAILRCRVAMSSFILTLVIVGCLIVPFVLLGGTLVQGLQSLAAQLKDGTLSIPVPPENVRTWPLVGVRLSDLWSAAATNFSSAFRTFAPQIKIIIPWLLSASARIGLTVLQFTLSIVIAGVILANAGAGAEAARSLAIRTFDKNGPEFARLVSSTIRSVTTGIFGVALIQSLLAGLGFLFVGLPAAGVWALVFLLAAILQVGVLVLLPAVIYTFNGRQYDQRRGFHGVVCLGGPAGQCAQASSSRAWRHSSFLGGVLGRHWRVRWHGNDRLICRSYRSIGGLQTFSHLA